MAEVYDGTESAPEGLLASLTEAALEVAAVHGVRGTSIDQELRLWRALGRVIRARHLDGVADNCENFLAELTEAAYSVALRRGFAGSFVEIQLDLWAALRRVLRATGIPAPAARAGRTRTPCFATL